MHQFLWRAQKWDPCCRRAGLLLQPGLPCKQEAILPYIYLYIYTHIYIMPRGTHRKDFVWSLLQGVVSTYMMHPTVSCMSAKEIKKDDASWTSPYIPWHPEKWWSVWETWKKNRWFHATFLGESVCILLEVVFFLMWNASLLFATAAWHFPSLKYRETFQQSKAWGFHAAQFFQKSLLSLGAQSDTS